MKSKDLKKYEDFLSLQIDKLSSPDLLFMLWTNCCDIFQIPCVC